MLTPYDTTVIKAGIPFVGGLVGVGHGLVGPAPLHLVDLLSAIISERVPAAPVPVLEGAEIREAVGANDIGTVLHPGKQGKPLRFSDLIEQPAPGSSEGRHLAGVSWEALVIEAPQLFMSSGAAVEILRGDLPGSLGWEPLAEEVAFVIAGEAADPDSRANGGRGTVRADM